MIGRVRRGSSTVVAVVGEVSGPVVAEIGRSPNLAVGRLPDAEQDPLEAAASSLRQAASAVSPFALVLADPLAMVAAAWREMWRLSGGPAAERRSAPPARSPASATPPGASAPPGAIEFEERCAAALSAWRAKRFELPDYYLVLARAEPDAEGPDLYLGPLRACRPQRVATVVIDDGADSASPAEQGARVLGALRSLRQGPWWPPLDELIDATRRFYPGALAQAGSSAPA